MHIDPLRAVLPSARLGRPRGLVLYLLLSTCWLSLPASAQPSPERMKERLQANAQELLDELALPEGKAAQAQAILDDDVEARFALFEKARGQGGREAMQEALQQRDEVLFAELGKVLTPDELARFKELRDAQRARMRGQRGAGGRPPRN